VIITIYGQALTYRRHDPIRDIPFLKAFPPLRVPEAGASERGECSEGDTRVRGSELGGGEGAVALHTGVKTPLKFR